MNRRSLWVLATAAVAGVAAALPQKPAPTRKPTPRPAEKIVFNRDVRPILSDTCFACHGPDKNKRQAGLRLDQPNRAVLPGDIVASPLAQRIRLADGADGQMPPASFHKTLTPAQKQTLLRWIGEGGAYQQHWAYEPPVKAAVPARQHPVDFLIRQRLARLGLKPSPPADRRTLIRRLCFDLTGLPPTPEEVDAFLADKRPDAYERVVDRLLASPHYGERMAQGWLDVVRYADTIGYHSDTPRNVWPYRDYVIRAFNENKRFDRFTLEQIAGDLLPDANQETRVGSAFNRLLLTTEEGGAQPKDYEARYLTDRVRAVGTVWLGQTTACAQCHDHKFDPISTRDFYTLGAFFADVDETLIGAREPGMLVPTPDQNAELARLDTRLKDLQTRFDRLWSPMTPRTADAEGGARLEIQPDGAILATGPNPTTTTYTITATADTPGPINGLRLEALPDPSLPSKGPGRAGNGNFVLQHLRAEVLAADGVARPVALAAAEASYEQTLYAEGTPRKRWDAAGVLDPDPAGWAILPEVGKTHTLLLTLATPLTLAPGEQLRLTLVQNHGESHTLGRLRLSAAAGAEPPAALRKELAAARKTRTDYEVTLPRCLVTQRNATPRTVRILPRGNFLDETGPVVQPALPHFLPQPEVSGRPLTRLDLAQWLVSRKNPLTARTVMNRLWKQFFGTGLSKVLEDLGAQGEPPTNPALLDWLACEFMDRGWDMRHMVRLLVTSDAYRQTSVASKALRDADPDNREVARQNRFRLDAELVRDNALAISGLLSPRIGGPSAKPYQPARYWENLNFPVREYQADQGENQYRRGLYTWWQRSFLHPSMLAFDAPSREECTAERNRSNIPQQALVLLNDPTYVEAARAFAARILKRADGVDSRIDWAWRQALQRRPNADERRTLRGVLNRHQAVYHADPEAAEALLKTGDTPAPADADKVELAAWTHVARVLLNLHETITRP